jgi:hypothetical protein
MGPKVLAACEFVEKTGKGHDRVDDTPSLLTGDTGTAVTLRVDGLELGPREAGHPSPDEGD